MKKVKGIELSLAITNELSKNGFDCFEVHPCKVVDGEENLPIQCIEQCDNKDAQFWSVYVHIIGGGLDCIADCETEELANELVKFLTVLCNVHEPDSNSHM